MMLKSVVRRATRCPSVMAGGRTKTSVSRSRGKMHDTRLPLTRRLVGKSDGRPVVDADKQRAEGSLVELDDDFHESADRLDLNRRNLLGRQGCPMGPTEIKGAEEEGEGCLELSLHRLARGGPKDTAEEVEEGGDGLERAATSAVSSDRKNDSQLAGLLRR